jgi:DNA mismatch repair protein MutH
MNDKNLDSKIGEFDHNISDNHDTANIENYIIDILSPFFGLTVRDFRNDLISDIDRSNRAVNRIIIERLLQLSLNAHMSSEFDKQSIVPKTIRIEANGNIKEHMSFPNFKFISLMNQEWEESDLFEYLTKSKFMFVIFKKTDDSDENSYFSSIVFWKICKEELDECERVWKRTKEIISCGVVLKVVGNRTINNLPNTSFSEIMHVRPKAQNGSDTYPLPDGRLMTKQCFWLDKRLIIRILKKEGII